MGELLSVAAAVYRKDEIAYDLRRLHPLHEGMRDENSSLVVPSAYTEGFSEKPAGLEEKPPARSGAPARGAAVASPASSRRAASRRARRPGCGSARGGGLPAKCPNFFKKCRNTP